MWLFWYVVALAATVCGRVATSQDLATDVPSSLLEIFVPRPTSIELLAYSSAQASAAASSLDSTLALSAPLDVVADFADTSGRVKWLVSHFQRRYNATVSRSQANAVANVHSLHLRCQLDAVACAGDASPPQLGVDESYSLTVQAGQAAVLAASNRAGFARGLETLLQLAQAQAVHPVPGGLMIKDQPRTAWRGLLIDVSRHFMPMGLLRRTLVEMAAFKLNTLHLHLTDAGDTAHRYSHVGARLHRPNITFVVSLRPFGHSIVPDSTCLAPRVG